MADTEPEPRRYKVVSEFIMAKTAALASVVPGARGGYVRVPLYKGALLPSDCPAEEVQRFLDRGCVEVVG